MSDPETKTRASRWSKEDIALVTKMYHDGDSYLDIAQAVSPDPVTGKRRSRSAVAGLVMRQGLSDGSRQIGINMKKQAARYRNRRWKDAQIARLTVLWKAGYGLRYITNQLPPDPETGQRWSQSAVMSKATALGLGKRAMDRNGSEQGKAAWTPPAPKPAVGEATPTEQPFVPPSPANRRPKRRLGVLQLTNRTCRWPLGDPGDPDFHFCGADCDITTPYCPDTPPKPDDKAEAMPPSARR